MQEALKYVVEVGIFSHLMLCPIPVVDGVGFAISGK